MACPIVSVIIPTYNEATYVVRLLKALVRQDFKDLEVIVSDAESKDGTEEAVCGFKDKLDIKLIEAPPRNPGAGRNTGAKIARGEWLLFLDADVDTDEANFIGILLSKTQEKGWNTSTAQMRVKDVNLLDRLGISILYHHQKLLSRTKHPVAQGYCILTKRRVFEQHGGFKEELHFGEDNDYVTRTGKHGFGFVDNTHYYVDLRRNRREGITLTFKSVGNEIYRLTHANNLQRSPFKYQFGKHQPRTP